MKRTLRKVLLSVTLLGASIAFPISAFALDTFEPNNNFISAFGINNGIVFVNIFLSQSDHN